MSEFRVTVIAPGADRVAFRLMCRHPVTGRQKWKSAETTDYREALKAAAKWEAELEEGRGSGSRISWAAFRQRFESEYLPGLAAKSRSAHLTALNRLESAERPGKLAHVTADMLSTFAAKVRAEGLSETSIRTYLKHLQVALTWANGLGMVGVVPAFPDVRRARRANGPMRGRPITDDEFRGLRKAVAGVVGDPAALAWDRYLEGLWWSGLRLAESMELWWDRADKIRVDLGGHQYPVLHVREELEKGRRDRVLPMAPEFAEFLRRTPESERSGPVFVLTGQRGRETRDPDWIGRRVSAIGKAAEIAVDATSGGKVRYVTAHDLRRSFGFRWAARVLPPVLMELMRHNDIKTTMRYYVGRNAMGTAATAWDVYAVAVSVSAGENDRRVSSEGNAEKAD